MTPYMISRFTIDCREGGMTQRPATSSLPVKPVTPRTWKQMQFDAVPGKFCFLNPTDTK